MTTLDQLATNQFQPAVLTNTLLASVSPAGLFGTRPSPFTTGLTFAYYGGIWPVNGTLTAISNGTVTLTGSSTNYVEVNAAGTVSKNTTAFTAGSTPLYAITTTASAISSTIDYRAWARPALPHRLTKTWPSDANYTLTGLESLATVIFLSGATLTVTRDLLVPANWCGWVRNNTGGSQSVRVVESGSPQGSGVTIANGKAAWCFGDGTNIYRGTDDIT